MLVVSKNPISYKGTVYGKGEEVKLKKEEIESIGKVNFRQATKEEEKAVKKAK